MQNVGRSDKSSLSAALPLSMPYYCDFPKISSFSISAHDPVMNAIEVTVGLKGSAVLRTVSVVIDGSDGGVEKIVTVGAGAVTICMLALSCGMPPRMAEIAAVTDADDTTSMVEGGVTELDAVTVIVIGSIVETTVTGAGWFDVTCRGQSASIF